MSALIRSGESSGHAARFDWNHTPALRHRLRLPPAAQLVMPRQTRRALPPPDPFEDGAELAGLPPQGEHKPLVYDLPVEVSGQMQTGRGRRLSKVVAVASAAVVAIWLIDLSPFPNTGIEELWSRVDFGARLQTPSESRPKTRVSANSPVTQPSAPPIVQPVAPQVASQVAPVAARPVAQPQLPPRQEPQRHESTLSAEEVDRLIDLGKKFLAQGDLETARRVLRRAAEAHDPGAALMLGTTYDPDGLRTLGMVGVPSDIEQAHSWYTRAAEFGSREAGQRLAALAQSAH